MKHTTRFAALLSAMVLYGTLSAQNVGINADGSTPGMMLDVKPTGSSDGIRINNAGGTAHDAVINFRNDGTDEFTMGVDDSNGDRFKIDDGGTLTTAPIISIEAGGDVGINTNNPDNALDVTGDAQISTYLLVGNPAAPSSQTLTGVQVFEMNGGYYSGFTASGCGTGWLGSNTGTGNTDHAIMEWDNTGTYSNQPLTSPHMWIPSNASSIVFEISHFITLENTFDGMYLQYSTNNGASWTDVVAGDFFVGGYNAITDGGNTSCNNVLNQNAWTGTQNLLVTAGGLTLSGTWVQFRFVGIEDVNTATGTYELSNFTVFVDAFSSATTGGAFATGNIYAENNIYAGSNVLLGDLAEYFPIVGTANKGDIITMLPGAGEGYGISQNQNDARAIGIYSSNPTLTLNDPNSGVPVALQGRVPVNVVGTNGPIKKGDYLTISSVPGHAMKADRPSYTVGRALEDFDGAEGQIICLVETGWYNPANGNATSGGNFTINRGDKSVRVMDATVNKESRIFLSLLGDLGQRYWVSDKGEGYYEISFSGEAVQDLAFDYFVDNASVSAETLLARENNTPANDPVLNQPYRSYDDKGNMTKVVPEGFVEVPDAPRHPDREFTPIPDFDQGTPPAAVPDENRAYVWSPKFGLIDSETGEPVEAVESGRE